MAKSKRAGHKATKKFAQSGQLKKEIQARHRHRNVKKRIDRKIAGRDAKEKRGNAKGKDAEEEEDGSDEDEDMDKTKKSKLSGMSVDDFLKGNFMNADEEEELSDADAESDDDNEGSDGESVQSLDDLEDSEEQHKIALSSLAQSDPEFYKFLQENDQELLDFQPGDDDSNAEEGGEDDLDDGQIGRKTLTKEELTNWSKAMIESHSLRAMRKMHIAFRSAVQLDEDEDDQSKGKAKRRRYLIPSQSLHTKLLRTTLRYTPIVLAHHLPLNTAKTKVKITTAEQKKKQKTLSQLLLSYFSHVCELLQQTSDDEILGLALREGGQIVPYIVGGRKAMRNWLKTCLKLWSESSDDVRLAAFLSVRALASAGDEAVSELILKNTYQTLVRSFLHTTAFSLPSINLMKNSAAMLYASDSPAAYQHTFRYIRQLAVMLRTSLKTKTTESHKQVYNWQYAHCVDFWALVLSNANSQGGSANDMNALIYPLVQIALGSTKLNTSTRSFPFHLHIVRSLLRITLNTDIYIPLGSTLVPIISSFLLSKKHKPSTSRPLDLETTIHATSGYEGTRIYSESCVEEAVYLTAEWAAGSLQSSIAFPEVCVPLTTLLRKAMKNANTKGGGTKEIGHVKGLVEHLEEGSKFIAAKRRGVSFGPGDRSAVQTWEHELKEQVSKGETPMGKWIGVLRRGRERKKDLAKKAREGDVEMVEAS